MAAVLVRRTSSSASPAISASQRTGDVTEIETARMAPTRIRPFAIKGWRPVLQTISPASFITVGPYAPPCIGDAMEKRIAVMVLTRITVETIPAREISSLARPASVYRITGLATVTPNAAMARTKIQSCARTGHPTAVQTCSRASLTGVTRGVCP